MEELAPKGLQGVYVDKTEIATTDSTGNLVYRGYKVVEIADKLSFEEVAYLVVYSRLPSKMENAEFRKFLADQSEIPDYVVRIIGEMKGMNIMDVLRTSVSALTASGRDEKALLSLAAKFPAIVNIAGNGAVKGKELPGSFSERFYYFMTGKNNAKYANLLEKILIMYMEHEFNASTFALRVTASTMADPVCAFTSALATLKGPLHGGANSEVLKFLLGLKNQDEVKKYVDETLEKKEKLMGFGHRVYKDKDPRAQYIKGLLIKHFSDREVVKNAVFMEEYVWEKKNLAANVDFYGALYMYLLGIEEKYYLPVFACSRVFGWVAHYIEQQKNNKLIRPLALYTGKTNQKL